MSEIPPIPHEIHFMIPLIHFLSYLSFAKKPDIWSDTTETDKAKFAVFSVFQEYPYFIISQQLRSDETYFTTNNENILWSECGKRRL